jgi:trimethylamine--corrinoid protein Co-methyltransferase
VPRIEPIEPKFHLDALTSKQLASIKSATLQIMEEVGVRFPSDRALHIFAEHGAQVNWESQVVRLPADMVLEALEKAPRSYVLSGRAEGTDLILDGRRSYFGTDGCGTLTIDFETGEERYSCKDDVAKMARVADGLSSIAFYWPMVSAQD